MRRILFCLALAAVPASCETGVHAAPIALYADFQAEPPKAAVIEAARDELRRIMTPIGLEFDWRPIAESQNQTSVELVVVSFKGSCDAEGVMLAAAPQTALGWTHISDGVILPFSDIDCGAIRGFVQADLRKIQESRRAEAYGRAVGRVLAHELYHVFADTQRHGSLGVGKAAYTVQELLSPAFRFEAHERHALKNGKTKEDPKLATAPARDRSVLTPSSAPGGGYRPSYGDHSHSQGAFDRVILPFR